MAARLLQARGQTALPDLSCRRAAGVVDLGAVQPVATEGAAGKEMARAAALQRDRIPVWFLQNRCSYLLAGVGLHPVAVDEHSRRARLRHLCNYLSAGGRNRPVPSRRRYIFPSAIDYRCPGAVDPWLSASFWVDRQHLPLTLSTWRCSKICDVPLPIRACSQAFHRCDRRYWFASSRPRHEP